MNETINEGWTWLFNSKKWHYFRNKKSLCGKFALLGKGEFEQGNDKSPDNCAMCKWKRLKELREQGAK
jgi:hypothetical protein